MLVRWHNILLELWLDLSGIMDEPNSILVYKLGKSEGFQSKCETNC